MTEILADTSAWIAFLRPQGPAKIKTALREALLDGRVRITWPVRAELLVGTRNLSDFQRLRTLTASLVSLACDEGLWERASQLGFTLRRRGLTVPLPDLLVAQAAMDADLELWHLDAHYEAIGAHSVLRTRNFLETAQTP